MGKCIHPNGDLYKQVDGVAMGSPLGPIFANYYMGNLETQVLSSLSPDLTPVAYCRYVDDVFLLVHKAHVLYNLRDLFERKSVLKFTYEIETNKKLAFLDCMISKTPGTLVTDVFVKETNTGECMSYNSFAPHRYKTSNPHVTQPSI